LAFIPKGIIKKIFRKGGPTEKISHLKIAKNSTIKPLSEGATDKRQKNSKKDQKNSTIKPLSHLLLYENPEGRTAPLPTPITAVESKKAALGKESWLMSEA